MVKILFLNGPSQDACDRFYGWPTPLLYAIAPTVKAIDEGEIDATYVPKIFEPVSYVEGVNDKAIKKDFVELLEKEQPDIICASTIYDSLYPTLQLLDVAKQHSRDIVTILGGPHIDEVHRRSHFFNECKPGNGLVDIAIAGDGENALKRIITNLVRHEPALSHIAEQAGKVWVYTVDGSSATTQRPLSLGTLPFMPLHLAETTRHQNDFDIFKDDQGCILPTAQMMTMRGCTNICGYCSESRMLTYVNTRPLDHILEEIYTLKSSGYKAIFFDNSTFGEQVRLEELLTELEKTGLSYGALDRFDSLQDPHLLEKYRRAGFVYLYCSIEQFDDATLHSVDKKLTEKHIIKAMHNLKDNGLQLGTSLLYGLPAETERSLLATLDFTKEWVDKGLIVLVSESLLSYHPGTKAGVGLRADFNRTPPNKGFPFDCFEEGQWYHPPHVIANYAEKILRWSEERFKDVLVRNRHSWYAQHLAGPSEPIFPPGSTARRNTS